MRKNKSDFLNKIFSKTKINKWKKKVSSSNPLLKTEF